MSYIEGFAVNIELDYVERTCTLVDLKLSKRMTIYPPSLFLLTVIQTSLNTRTPMTMYVISTSTSPKIPLSSPRKIDQTLKLPTP